jgi:hypothetical protein
MNPDFQSDADELLRQAAAVGTTADRVFDAARAAPDPEPSPRWAATTAAELAGSVIRQQLEQLGHDVTTTAQQIRSAARAYQEADERTANRFRLSR